MKKKKNMGTRILCAPIFLGVCGSVMLIICSLSAEDGQMSDARSEIVAEKIKEQMNTRLETTEEGIALNEHIRYFAILYSPYDSDWNANIRKLTRSSIYFTLAASVYIISAVLGVNKLWCFLLTVGICSCFTFGDEYHQKSTGRISSMSDVYLGTLGTLVSTCIWTVISIVHSRVHLLVNKTYRDA